MKRNGLGVHVGFLVLACAASIYVWTRDPKTTAAAEADVAVWSGRPDEVRHMTFESNGRKVSLDSRADAHGRWFMGSTESTPFSLPDAGAPASRKTTPFVSVTGAQKVAQALGPLKALRQIGRVDPGRDAEFGFKEPVSTLSVTVGAKEHRLTIGSSTPNGVDRYVREDGSGYVYAVKGDFVRDLELGEGALFERAVHDFQDSDIQSVRVTAGAMSREVLRRGPVTKRIWADPASPDKADETISNWLSKVDRLQPTEYLSSPPSSPELIVRLEYRVRGAEGLFSELAKAPGQNGQPEYLLRSEHTRQWAKVHALGAEQVQQDLGSVLK